MEGVKLRETVLGYIDNADERLLRVLKAVAESYNENDTVAFHPDGKPMSRKEYKKALDEAENQVSEGDYISAEDFLNDEL